MTRFSFVIFTWTKLFCTISMNRQKKKVSVKHVLRECYDDITKYIPSELLDERYIVLLTKYLWYNVLLM